VEADMTILRKLFGGKREPTKRIRICSECGMPVEDHKEWCSILRIRQAMEQRQLRPTQSES
jgi:hypothetical protein